MNEKFDFSKIEDQKKFEEHLEKKKDKIIREAQEESLKMNEELDKKEEKNGVIDKELSPGVIEKIMEKVQDVDEEGTFFHQIDAVLERGHKTDEDDIKRILKEGVLAGIKEFRDNQGNKAKKEEWVEKIRKVKNAYVFFNRVGMTSGYGRPHKSRHGTEISRTEFLSLEAVGHLMLRQGVKEGFIIIFDGTFLEETETEKQKMKFRQFRPYGGYGIEHQTNRKYINSDYGFVTRSRIAPRYFKGIMIQDTTIKKKEMKKN